MSKIKELLTLIEDKDWDSVESQGYTPADLEAMGFDEEAIDEYSRWIYVNIK